MYLDETIDPHTYRQQMECIGWQLRVDLLDFADELLADAAQTGVDAPPDTKRRFEQALYPDGRGLRPGRGVSNRADAFCFQTFRAGGRR